MMPVSQSVYLSLPLPPSLSRSLGLVIKISSLREGEGEGEEGEEGGEKREGGREGGVREGKKGGRKGGWREGGRRRSLFRIAHTGPGEGGKERARVRK